MSHLVKLAVFQLDLQCKVMVFFELVTAFFLFSCCKLLHHMIQLILAPGANKSNRKTSASHHEACFDFQDVFSWLFFLGPTHFPSGEQVFEIVRSQNMARISERRGLCWNCVDMTGVEVELQAGVVGPV